MRDSERARVDCDMEVNPPDTRMPTIASRDWMTEHTRLSLQQVEIDTRTGGDDVCSAIVST
jgi:hypothetical protein